MSLPIATVTILGFKVKSVESRENNHKIVGTFGESGLSSMVRHYQKADQFFIKEGDHLIVIGKPVILASKTLVIESNFLQITEDKTLDAAEIAIAGTMGQPYERKNDRAPLGFGVAIDHYDRDKREKVSYWFNIKLWGLKADSARMVCLVKGNYLAITGRLELSVYNDKPQVAIHTRDFALLPKAIKAGGDKFQPDNGYPISEGVLTPPVMDNVAVAGYESPEANLAVASAPVAVADSWDEIPF